MIDTIGEEFFEKSFNSNLFESAQRSMNFCDKSDKKVQIAAQSAIRPRMGKVSIEANVGYSEEKGKEFIGKGKWEFEFGGKKENNSDREMGSRNEPMNGSDVNSVDRN